jgi:molybdopterin-containing oxidoreductase family membrane subunit
LEDFKTMIKSLLSAFGSVFKGGVKYYAWVLFLCIFIAMGISAYLRQLESGLIVTAMRDQVSWGFYLANFTFLVGVAAAAVLLVIPAYVYHFKPIKEIVLFGEMLAIAAIVMCILFIMVDVGQPLRVWHLLPVLGTMNFPSSMLAWDVIVLNGYLIINTLLVVYALSRFAAGKPYRLGVVLPLILLSIPWAVSIHTVTAFLYNGLPSRPFWNASILAPRFLASAFCSGPALMLIVLQIMRKVTRVEIDDKAIFKIAEVIAYTMAINLLLLGAEVFKEFYSGSIHKAPLEYLFHGLHGKTALVPWTWTALAFNVTAFLIFLIPKARESFIGLNLGAILMVCGVYIEKGLGLVVPGFIPDTLGEIYEYLPSKPEIVITIGVWAMGALLFTLLTKFSIPLYLRHKELNTGDGVK